MDNGVAIDLIATHIRRKMKERASRFRPHMAIAGPPTPLSLPSTPNSQELIKPYENLVVLPETPQLKVYSIFSTPGASLILS